MNKIHGNVSQSQSLRSIENVGAQSEAAAARRASREAEGQSDRVSLRSAAPEKVGYDRPRPAADQVETASKASQAEPKDVAHAVAALRAKEAYDRSGPVAQAISQAQSGANSNASNPQLKAQSADAPSSPTEAIDAKVKVAELGAGGGTPIAGKTASAKVTAQGIDGTTSAPRDEQSRAQ